MRVAFVGLGLIGAERLAAAVRLRDERGVEITGVVDFAAASRERARSVDVPVLDGLDALLATEPDVVFVATPHDSAVDIVEHLLAGAARVVVEKPLGRNLREATRLASLAGDPSRLWLGLNYRYFRGIEALLRDVREGWFGEVVALELAMGHGGAPGMDEGWKLDPVRAGGGVLIDPGIHLLNLAQLAGGKVKPLGGTAWSGFWRTGIEEECHLVLTAPSVPIINLSVSLVRWRSTFRMEVHGTDGYGAVTGRNRSYGPQTYRRGRRWAWRSGGSQADHEEAVVVDPGDDVFLRETRAMLWPEDASPRPCDLDEALGAMELLDRCRDVLGLPTSTPRSPEVT